MTKRGWLTEHVTDDFLMGGKIRTRTRIGIGIGIIFVFVWLTWHSCSCQFVALCFRLPGIIISERPNPNPWTSEDLFVLSDTAQPLKLHASTLAIIKLRHQSARTRAAQLQIAMAITSGRGAKNGAVGWEHVLGPARRYRYRYYASPVQLGDYAIYKIWQRQKLHLPNAIERTNCQGG